MMMHMKHVRLSVLLMECVVACSVMAAESAAAPSISDAKAATEWNQWRGPNRDGISPDRDWSTDWKETGPKVPWKAKVGLGCSSVVVGGRRAFTMGNVQVGEKEVEVIEKVKQKSADGKETEVEQKTIKKQPVCEDSVYCLNVETGEVMWKRGWEQPLDPSGFEGGPTSTPCVDGDRVYFQGRTGRVTCHEVQTGRIIWEYMPEKPASTIWGGIASSPMVDGKLLIAAQAAFDKETGAIIWKPKRPLVWNSPVVFTSSGRRLLGFLSNNGLAALQSEDGKELWFLDWAADQNVADPVFFEDMVFVSSRRTKATAEQCGLFQIDRTGPRAVWKNSNLMSYFQVRVLLNGYVFGCDEQNLKCLDIRTGEVKWAAGGGRGQLIASNGMLIIAWDGAVVIAEASSNGYREIAKAKCNAGSSPPSLSGGYLFCRGKGEITCLDVRK